MKKIFELNSKTPKWMQIVLKIAGVYNLIWGAWVILFPKHFFQITGMEMINHLVIWQGMGMVIGVYGIAYYLASFHPLRHWIIIFVGLLGKIFGPIGFIINYLQGNIPIGFGYTLFTNDFLWWIPFILILKEVHFKYNWKLYNKKEAK